MLDEEKLIDLYRRHNRELFVFIARYTGSTEAAEDILHDCFENLIEYASRNELTTDNLRSFLFTTARNLCINRHKRLERDDAAHLDDSLPDSRQTTPELQAGRNELASFINRLVERLDEPDRSIFIMKKELDLTYPEIAKATGISERTVRRRLSAILGSFQSELTNAGFFIFFPFCLAAFLASIVIST